MADFTAFLTRVVPRAMGVAEPLARQAILDTAIEFCEQTNVLQETETITILAGEEIVNLTPPVGTIAHSLRKAWIKGVPLALPAEDAIGTPFAYPNVPSTGDVQAPVGTPTDATMRFGEVILYPQPDAEITGGLVVRYSIKPLDDATVLPDELGTRWRDAIVSGSVARLLTMRGTNHFDPVEAARHDMVYRRFINHARIAARLGDSAGGLRASPQMFA